MKKLSALILVMVIGLSLGLISPALAEYPERPITLLVSFRAGGNVDTLARLLAKPMGNTLGQPVLPVNKPGRGGGVAAMTLKRAEPDGYTLCLNIGTAYTFNPHTVKDPRYTVDDFRYISCVAQGQEAFVSLPDKPWKDWKGMIKTAKEKGGLTYSTFTPVERTFIKHIEKVEAVKLTPVPTKGGAGMVPQVLGGHVDFAFSGGIHYSYAKAGKMIVLASVGEDRLVGFPDAPTLIELGYGVAFSNPMTMAAPKGVPEEVVTKIDKAISTALKDPEVIDLIENKVHWLASYMGPEELTKTLKRTSSSYEALIATLK
jgi:tripartite-type tricarboxylate transporter receptor subunit TctC